MHEAERLYPIERMMNVRLWHVSSKMHFYLVRDEHFIDRPLNLLCNIELKSELVKKRVSKK